MDEKPQNIKQVSQPIENDSFGRNILLLTPAAISGLTVIFFIIACVLPTKDRFVMTSGGQQRIITRQDNPTIYWSTEAGVMIVAGSLIVFGIYRGRKQ
jgi:hypothetical protein